MNIQKYANDAVKSVSEIDYQGYAKSAMDTAMSVNYSEYANSAIKEISHSINPESLEAECTKCATILKQFAEPEELAYESQLKGMVIGQGIPKDIIKNAKGIAIMSIVKAGFAWSGRYGSGLVLTKLPNNQWSAPFAIGTGGVGFGWQIGAGVTETIFVLNTIEAVDAFFKPKYTFGGNISVAAGPYGRAAEIAADNINVPPIYSYSFSKGLFAGLSLEGTVVYERERANYSFYGDKVYQRQIMNGSIKPPAAAAVLYQTLQEHFQ